MTHSGNGCSDERPGGDKKCKYYYYLFYGVLYFLSFLRHYFYNKNMENYDVKSYTGDF